MALVWVVLAAGLLLFELHHLAFYALFAGIGAAAGAVVALVAPDGYVAQGATVLGVTMVGVWLARPYVSAVYERRHHTLPVTRGVHGGLIGHEATALDEVSGPGSVGHVRFVGETWLATTSNVDGIAAGSTVLIVAVEGTTLVVVPTEDRRS